MLVSDITKDAIVKSVNEGTNMVPYDKLRERKYTFKNVYKYDTGNPSGSGLFIEGADQPIKLYKAPMSEDNIPVEVNPDMLFDKLKLLMDKFPTYLSDAGGGDIRMVVKLDELEILGDSYGHYKTINYSPTNSRLTSVETVGRMVCTNGSTIEMPGVQKYYQNIGFSRFRDSSPETLYTDLLKSSQDYVGGLIKFYDNLCKIKSGKSDYDNIVKIACEKVYPFKQLSSLDRELMAMDNPDSLQKFDDKQHSLIEKRSNLTQRLNLLYDAEDHQNFSGSLMQSFLALTNAETHGVFGKRYDSYRAYWNALAVTRLILKSAGFNIYKR